MNTTLKNAIDSVFEKLNALTDEEFQERLSDSENGDITHSFVELFTFCRNVFVSVFAIKFIISSSDDFLFPEFDYKVSSVSQEAANDCSFLMAA